MVEDFVREYARRIASYPDAIVVERNHLGDHFDEIVITAHKEDAGKLIGREGRTINALKTLIGGCKAKDGVSYRINVRTADE